MKKRSQLLAIAALVAGSFLLPVSAQAKQVEFRIVAEQEIEEVDASGRRRVRTIPAKEIAPGEEVIYTIFFKNVTSGPLTDVVITDPIPVDMRLVMGTAFGSGTDITYSADKGSSFATPGRLKVRTNEGRIRLARPDEYTHIRWNFGGVLKPQERGYVSFRAILK